MNIRKNHAALTKAEWQALIAAIDAMHGSAAPAPAYRSFVALHVDAMSGAHMDWSVHSMSMGGHLMRGKNFLAWHRRFLKIFEDRLKSIDSSIMIPYWDSVTDQAIPAALADPGLLARWSVTRSWDASLLASPSDLVAVKAYSGTFTGFQTLLEQTIHADTHIAIGGNMAGPSSPADPLFWLHHAFIDKTWANWQATPHGKEPPHPEKTLKPAELDPGDAFGVSTTSLLKIAALGYSYA